MKIDFLSLISFQLVMFKSNPYKMERIYSNGLIEEISESEEKVRA